MKELSRNGGGFARINQTFLEETLSVNLLLQYSKVVSTNRGQNSLRATRQRQGKAPRTPGRGCCATAGEWAGGAQPSQTQPSQTKLGRASRAAGVNPAEQSRAQLPG